MTTAHSRPPATTPLAAAASATPPATQPSPADAATANTPNAASSTPSTASTATTRDIEAILTAWLDTPVGIATARADMWCENGSHDTPEPRKKNSRWCSYCAHIREHHGNQLPDTKLLDMHSRGIKLGKEATARRLIRRRRSA
ncbi:MAG: hypothetical protein WKF58_04920 [Ilumatobacteraceae bacterium]